MKKKYEILVLDWDGTLFDSISIKINNASLILINYLQSIISYQNIPPLEDFKKAYLQFSGVSRRQLFDKILYSLCGVKLVEQHYEVLSSQFTLLNQKKLYSANLFKDAILLLNKAQLGFWSTKFIISSSVPEHELDDISRFHLTNEQKLSFVSIIGTQNNFRKGYEHFDWILYKYSCNREDLLFVGDDQMDVYLAQEYGVDYLHINRRDLSNKSKHKMIKSLTEIEPYLIKNL